MRTPVVDIDRTPAEIALLASGMRDEGRREMHVWDVAAVRYASNGLPLAQWTKTAVIVTRDSESSRKLNKVMRGNHTETHVCTYICMYACMYVCTYACMYRCMYVCICKYVCMNVCVSVRLFACVYVVYIDTCIHMHVNSMRWMHKCRYRSIPEKANRPTAAAPTIRRLREFSADSSPGIKLKVRESVFKI